VAKLAQGLATLGDSPEDKLRLQDLIAETLSNLENAEDNVGVVRAQVGARLNTIDSTRDMHEGTELVSNKVMSEVRDLDYAEALTRLTLENTILQAAQQSFAKISKLSLFDFLR
jgi:flagellar hook-associated protein 3 FlgL